MSKICKLPIELTNIISAGEVVERPYNIVKELVENSIDALSKNIKIILEDGGIRSICVIDDGYGMDREDCLLCFLPHYTSKIKNKYDLFKLNTLGFRGEALASIASVSKVTLLSSNNNIGTKVIYKNGKEELVEDYNLQRGTQIKVEELFFNTPVRLKFLKSKEAELSFISYLIDKLSLSRPDISFTLINNNKEIFNYNSRIKNSLLKEIYGLEVLENNTFKEYQESRFYLSFNLVSPNIYRSNNKHITFIVNGRYVKNYYLTDIVMNAFKGYLPISKFPIICIYINIDPSLIDCNIHPRKEIIKISIEKELGSILFNKIKETLEQLLLIPNRDNEINNNKDFILSSNKIVDNSFLSFSDVSNINLYNNNLSINNNKELNTNKFNKIPNLRFIGVYDLTYIILEGEDGLYLLDQHASCEKINYEELLDHFTKEEVICVNLLVPIKLEFTYSEVSLLELHDDILKNLGFKLSYLKNYIEINKIPVFLKDKNLNSIFYEIIDYIQRNEDIDIIKLRDKIIKRMSCRMSIKAHDLIGETEVYEILKKLNNLKDPYHCPHGRPTLIKLSKKKIMELFERI